MAINSRTKGAVGEREAAGMFREHGYDAHRTAQHCGMTGVADVEGIPYVHLEVKRRENLNLYDAISQAVRDHRKDELPTVMWRKNNCDWLMTMRFEDWIEMYKAYEMSRTETERLKDIPFAEE